MRVIFDGREERKEGEGDETSRNTTPGVIEKFLEPPHYDAANRDGSRVTTSIRHIDVN